jgi:hypothetical protein
VLRESTYRGHTYYRDKPLLPGLFAEPGEEPIPYRAIYRPHKEIAGLVKEAGLQLLVHRSNRQYRLVEMKKAQLRLLNRMSRGRLAGQPGRAQVWAKRLHRARFIASWPGHYFCKATRIPAWNMDNYWFVAKKR